MRIQVASRIAFNTAMAQFAPDHGRRGYRVEDNGDITIMVIDNCDHCGCECEGANSVIFVKPRKFVRDVLAWMVTAGKIVQTEVRDEIGCTEDGDAVCSECWAKAQDGDKADKLLLDIGEGGAG